MAVIAAVNRCATQELEQNRVFFRRLLEIQDLLRSVLAGADAIGNADAAVGVAGERQTGELPAEALDTVEAVEMADAVLRHSRFPFVDTGKKGRGAEAENLLQFGADDSSDGIVGKLPDIFGA